MSGFDRTQPVHDREAKAQRGEILRELGRIGDALALIALSGPAWDISDGAVDARAALTARIVGRERGRDARGRPT